jgi:Membrane-bound serine protease (ClpP class)
MNFLLMGGVTPFTVSLLVLVGLVLLEFVLLLVGTHFFGLLDDLLPDLHFDADHDHDFAFGKALYFVGFGKVPFLMVLMSFLASFGLSGYAIQSIAHKMTGGVFPLALAVPAAVVFGLMLTSRITAVLARIMPREQTTAVSDSSFVGREATVSYGTATAALPATAEVIDQHGRTHHIQLKAAAESESFEEGSKALIVRTEDGFFFGKSIN